MVTLAAMFSFGYRCYVDEANLTTEEKALLIDAVKSFKAAVRDYERVKPAKAGQDMEGIALVAAQEGKDIDDVGRAYIASRNGELAMERGRSRYQAVVDTIFRLKGLDWTRFKIDYDEATESLSVRKTALT
jgi:hypothetical protein